MTLDQGIDMGHVETHQSGLPTEALHDLDLGINRKKLDAFLLNWILV